MGFEPTVPFPVHALSRRVPSATRPSLQRKDGENDHPEGAEHRGRRDQGLAEREGFEPSVRFPVRRFSKPVPSATRPPLRHSEAADHSRRAWCAPGSGKRSRGRSTAGTPARPGGETGGEGGIRTLETLSRLAVFKTAAFDRSATSPGPEDRPPEADRRRGTRGKLAPCLAGDRIALPNAKRSGDGMALPSVDSIGELGRWIADNESLLSGLASLVVLVGLPPARKGGTRRLFTRAGKPRSWRDLMVESVPAERIQPLSRGTRQARGCSGLRISKRRVTCLLAALRGELRVRRIEHGRGAAWEWS